MNYKYLSKWKSEKVIKQVCRETKLALTDNNSLTKRLESILIDLYLFLKPLDRYIILKKIYLSYKKN